MKKSYVGLTKLFWVQWSESSTVHMMPWIMSDSYSLNVWPTRLNWLTGHRIWESWEPGEMTLWLWRHLKLASWCRSSYPSSEVQTRVKSPDDLLLFSECVFSQVLINKVGPLPLLIVLIIIILLEIDPQVPWSISFLLDYHVWLCPYVLPWMNFSLWHPSWDWYMDQLLWVLLSLQKPP